MKFSIAIIIFLFISSTSFGFTLNSSSNSRLQGWADSNIKLMVNTANCPAGMDVPAIIEAAADLWNKIPTSSVKVSYGGTTTSTSMSNPTTVYCETNFQAVLGADQNYVPGAASVDGSSGRIARGILYLNASSGQGNISRFDQTILKVILAHEIGHILGLGHSDSHTALMYYDASERNTLSVSQDDIDGISYLYPSNEFNDSHFAGCGLIRNIPPPSSGNKILWLCVLLFPLLSVVIARQTKIGKKH